MTDLTAIIGSMAWPVTALLICFYFRDPIKRGVERLTELGPTGVKFAAPAEQAQVSKKGDEDPLGIPKSASLTIAGDVAGVPARQTAVQEITSHLRSSFLPDVFDTALDAVRRDLAARVGGQRLEDQIEVLCHSVASRNIEMSYERIYTVIWGTQLNLLTLMNPALGLDEETVRRQYEVAAQRHPGAFSNYSQEKWIEFLTAMGLCHKTETNNLALTSYGRGFLRYLVDVGHSFLRAF